MPPQQNNPDGPSPNSTFTFNEEVAVVFDDMLQRSVPFYAELQRMLGEQAAYFAQPETAVYDLGCATATTLIGLAQNHSR